MHGLSINDQTDFFVNTDYQKNNDKSIITNVKAEKKNRDE
jgi:hypothetical protein